MECDIVLEVQISPYLKQMQALTREASSELTKAPRKCGDRFCERYELVSPCSLLCLSLTMFCWVSRYAGVFSWRQQGTCVFARPLHACRWGSITAWVRHVTRLVYLVQKHERSIGAKKI